MYDVGDYVKGLVIAVEPEKQRLKLSLKASHFENDGEDDSSDEEGGDEEEEDEDEDEEAEDDTVLVDDDNDDDDDDDDTELMKWARRHQKLSGDVAEQEESAEESGSEAEPVATTKPSVSSKALTPSATGVGKIVQLFS